MRRLFRGSIYREIENLDPDRDHQKIYRLSTLFEFPFDTRRALEFALFRTFAVPSVGSLLHVTGEFERRPQKRYDDTNAILSEIINHGYDSPEGAAAIGRLNRIHARFPISNDDLLYVLSTFIFEPIRWNRQFGWRALSGRERYAAFRFWCETGRRMGIRDIPQTENAFEQFNIAYEAHSFRYNEASRLVADSMRNLFASWLLPRTLWPLLYPAFYAFMDDHLREALGYPAPPVWLRAMISKVLRVRAFVIAVWPIWRHPSS